MGRFLNGVLWMAMLIGVLVGAARLLAIRWWQIPSDDPILGASIAPTLRGGDWVLLWHATPPKFGTLTICPDPSDDARVVIGRVIGEAGDQVTVEGATIRLNDHEALTETECQAFHVKDPATGEEVEQTCSTEAIGGALHQRGNLPGQRQEYALKSSRRVGEGKAFLVSDNRGFPYDSRNYGSVDRAACKETIFFRVVSQAGFGDSESRLTYIR
jgi:signal peptidase I